MQQRYNHTWKPATELNNEVSFREFNTRFVIDMTFSFKTLFRKHRVRFVQHPDITSDMIRVFTMSMPRKWRFWEWGKTLGEYGPKSVESNEVLLSIVDCESIYGLKL